MPYGLATSLSSLDAYLQIEDPEKIIGCDTETEGLNVREDNIVGISISLESDTGLYLPVGHKGSLHENLPITGVIDRLRNWANARKDYHFAFFNGPFDRNFLEQYGGWVPKRWVDAMELVYLENADRQKKDLKSVAKKDLKFDMAKFESLFDWEEVQRGSYNIALKRPEDVTDYACADADATRRLVVLKRPVWEEYATIVQIDTQLADVLREMHRLGGMELNLDYIHKCKWELEQRAEALQQQIWRMSGIEFDIQSPRQVGNVLFDEMGIKPLGLTKTGQPKTDAETLDQLSKLYPIVEYIQTFRKVAKARGTYFEKLEALAQSEKPVRFNFNQYHVPTFRLSAPGGGPDRDGATGVNIQAVSNGESRSMMGVDVLNTGGASNYIDDALQDDVLVDLEDEGFGTVSDDGPISASELHSLPYVVDTDPKADGDPTGLTCFRETCASCPAMCAQRGVDVTRRLTSGLRVVPSVRQSFRVPDGFTMVSCDYDRQELVIAANLSKEPLWVKALGNNEDLHAITAAGAFGHTLEEFFALPKAEQKKKRNVGKMLNFATLYGATASTLASRAGISMVEAEKIYEGFRNTYGQLFEWIREVHHWARVHGYTTTYFGRKRWLEHFYSLHDRKQAAFADRSSVNTAIQGTGADVTRIAMVKAHNNFKNEGITRDMAYLVMQVHDELSFAVRPELINDILPVIKRSMEFNVKGWDVQLSVGAKVGQIWGAQKEI